MPLYPNARHLVSGAILLLACISLTSPALPDEVASDAVLPADHGYMLIRVVVNRKERISILAFRNVDTNGEVRLRMRSFEGAGASAWMALVAAPSGRYFWSEYAPTFNIGVEDEQAINQIYSRGAPGAADDSFEIVSGVVNYVGDWRMRVVPTARRRLEPAIQYNTPTLERYVEQYPEIAGRYEIYMSMMGKAAISLNELAKILEDQAE
jgi:hypothetical protein